MQITSKNTQHVMIYTKRYWIEADLHILPGSRLTDALNVKTKDFLAVTDVKVIEPQSRTIIYKIDFAAINRADIQIIFPIETAPVFDGDAVPEEEFAAPGADG